MQDRSWCSCGRTLIGLLPIKRKYEHKISHSILVRHQCQGLQCTVLACFGAGTAFRQLGHARAPAVIACHCKHPTQLWPYKTHVDSRHTFVNKTIVMQCKKKQKNRNIAKNTNGAERKHTSGFLNVQVIKLHWEPGVHTECSKSGVEVANLLFHNTNTCIRIPQHDCVLDTRPHATSTRGDVVVIRPERPRKVTRHQQKH